MIKRPDICFSVARSLYCCHGFIDLGISARKKPLLILDYDGTLTPIVTRPEDALLDESTRELLQKLLARGAKIVIVSGRPIDFLNTQFEGLAVDFAAEHGSYIEQDGEAVLSALDESWLPKIEQIFENWTREHPGSHYEKSKMP